MIPVRDYFALLSATLRGLSSRVAGLAVAGPGGEKIVQDSNRAGGVGTEAEHATDGGGGVDDAGDAEHIGLRLLKPGKSLLVHWMRLNQPGNNY